jgi:hypothetical protein
MARGVQHALLAALAMAVASPSSSADGTCPAVLLASPLTKIRAGPWCGPAATRISAAQNEYESFQVVVNQPTASVTDVALKFTAGPATGIATLNAPESTLVHRVHFIDIAKASDCDGGPGPWPDALIPAVDPWFGEKRNALPATLSANSSLLIFWVDLFVAPGTPAGNYSAAVTVSFGASLPPVSVPLVLRVFGFKLDSTSKVYKSTYGRKNHFNAVD